MTDVMGFVAAGGKSSRMRTDKAWLELGGQPMIERVIAALKPVTTNVAIIANGPEYARLGFPVFADELTGVGPLEAIRSAMANTLTSRLVLVGCDLPFVTPELFRFLLSITGNYEAIVPLGADGKLEPLCAIYSKESEPIVRDLIARGQKKVSHLFDRVPTCLVAFDEIRHLARSELFFENVNTPEDYLRAIETVSRSGSQRT